MSLLRACVFLGAILVGCGSSMTPAPSLTASVTNVAPSLESRDYGVATVRFENTGASSCTIAKYVVSWPAGSEEITPSQPLALAAHQSLERRVKLESMTYRVLAAQLTVTASCS